MMWLLLFAVVPLEIPIHEHFDSVELHHFYTERGEHLWDQVIWREWNRAECRFEIVDFRMTKKGYAPRRNPDTQRYEAIWHDNGVMRKVTADSFRESWLQHDPEVEERRVFPKELRKELAKPLHLPQEQRRGLTTERKR